MEANILFAWLGNTDLRLSKVKESAELGPIGNAVQARSFSRIVVLSDYASRDDQPYVKWLGSVKEIPVELFRHQLSGPTNFKEIYEAAVKTIDAVKKNLGKEEYEFTYHLSPGTPAMAAVWIILSKTSHPAELIESSPEEGVRTVSFPFDLCADYLPPPCPTIDGDIIQLTQGLPPAAPEFEDIIYRCREMRRIVSMARRLSLHDVPVLIQGASGTGKELFARAIHASSPRGSGPFVAVNCGAIPDQLVESEFFGHVKGAFTGAVETRVGYLEKSDGGSLFLDEIGDLPLAAQVKLLRTLQEGSFRKVGSTKSQNVDVRIIAATNRNLLQEVEEGRFREDLFHRLAVGFLRLPSLGERSGDLNLLVDHILSRINRDSKDYPGWKDKKISAGARNLIARHSWPGNVRELFNTLSRAAIWTVNDTIREEDIRQALLPITRLLEEKDQILNRLLGRGLDLPRLISDVARHYLERALIEAGGNKTKAAKLVGLPSYQTFSNWMQKYGIGT